MSRCKYLPIKTFLNLQPFDRVTLSFDDIERMLGFRLPRSKRYPAWWSNNASNNTMTAQWLEAGFRTGSVDIAGEELTFQKVVK
jgi:hypothetical protein